MTLIRSLFAMFVLLSPGLALAEGVSQAGAASEPSSLTLYAKVSGMQSAACEVYAEERLTDALETLLDVRANHETGWIKLELEALPQESAGSKEKQSADPVDPATATSIRDAVEQGCGFELETVQTQVPNSWLDAAEMGE